MKNPCNGCTMHYPGCDCSEWKEYKAAMEMESERLAGVTLLGNQKTKYPTTYSPLLLETFENAHPNNDYMVSLRCHEFTSLCPKTGQPDFAEIEINYIPRVKMVESKSLKLYLFSFRNHGDFHEDCINIIMKDLLFLMEPKYIEVRGLFTPRGGIAIWPFANCSKDPEYDAIAIQRRFDILGREGKTLR